MASSTLIGTRQCRTFGMMHDERLFTCPYNESHHVLGAKMATHLVKCRKNHPCEEIGICRYDSTHHVPAPELAYHESICTASKIIVPDILETVGITNEDTDFNRNKPPPNASVDRIIQDSAEDWDEEILVTGPRTYDPKKKLENGSFMFVPQGKTKSERKLHRKMEFEKFQRGQQGGFQSGEEPDEEEFTSTVTRRLEEPPQLRLPREMPGMLFTEEELEETRGRGSMNGGMPPRGRGQRMMRGMGVEPDTRVGMGAGWQSGSEGRGISVGRSMAPTPRPPPGFESVRPQSQSILESVRGRGSRRKDFY